MNGVMEQIWTVDVWFLDTGGTLMPALLGMTQSSLTRSFTLLPHFVCALGLVLAQPNVTREPQSFKKILEHNVLRIAQSVESSHDLKLSFLIYNHCSSQQNRDLAHKSGVGSSTSALAWLLASGY